MNKQAITKTAVCYWSADDDCYVVKSPLTDRVVGIGNTQGQAWELFIRHLDSVYTAYLEGRLSGYEKRGRPRKGLVAFNVSVQPITKERIVQLALDFCSSQGDVVDFLTFFHDIMKTQELVQKSPVEPFDFSYDDRQTHAAHRGTGYATPICAEEGTPIENPGAASRDKAHDHKSPTDCPTCAQTRVTDEVIKRVASSQKRARGKKN